MHFDWFLRCALHPSIVWSIFVIFWGWFYKTGDFPITTEFQAVEEPTLKKKILRGIPDWCFTYRVAMETTVTSEEEKKQKEVDGVFVCV